MRLNDRQWALMEYFFPEPKRRRDRRGRPWASNRECVEGILWVLRTGARWRDLPPEYPSGPTCWRRLRQWDCLLYTSLPTLPRLHQNRHRDRQGRRLRQVVTCRLSRSRTDRARTLRRRARGYTHRNQIHRRRDNCINVTHVWK